MKSRLLFAAAAGLALRLALAIFAPGNYDLESYGIVAGIVRAGGNVYAETFRYNYGPAWMYGVTALSYLPLPLHVAVRLLLAAVDVYNGYLILRVAGDRAGIAYWLNPLPILLLAWGQFETLAALPLLLALGRAHDRSWRVWLLAMLAVLTKQIVLFPAWALLAYRFGRPAGTPLRGYVLFALLGVAFCLSFVPFLPGAPAAVIAGRVMSSAGAIGNYGVGVVDRLAGLALFLAVAGTLPLWAPRLRLRETEAVGLSAVAFAAFMPGLRYYYWALVPLLAAPLAARHPRASGLFYALAGTVALIWLLGTIHPDWVPDVDGSTAWTAYLVNLAWPAAVLWFVAVVRAGAASVPGGHAQLVPAEP